MGASSSPRGGELPNHFKTSSHRLRGRPPAPQARVGAPCRALGTPKATPHDAGRQRGETLDEGRGGEHPIVGVAARLQNAGGGIHRVADERDLSPQSPEFADRNRAAVQAGAEVGDDAKLAIVDRALRGDPLEGSENGADARGRIRAGRKAPRQMRSEARTPAKSAPAATLTTTRTKKMTPT